VKVGTSVPMGGSECSDSTAVSTYFDTNTSTPIYVVSFAYMYHNSTPRRPGFDDNGDRDRTWKCFDKTWGRHASIQLYQENLLY
jgi:hypothetical protein